MESGTIFAREKKAYYKYVCMHRAYSPQQSFMIESALFLKHTKRLLSLNHTLRFQRHDIESHRFAERTALPNRHNIPLLDGKGRRTMGHHILVTLLKTTVLGNIMQIISTHDNRALHFGRNDEALENAAANRHIASKGAFLVDVVAFNGRRGGFDTESNGFYKAHGFLLARRGDGAFLGNEYGILLLVGFFVLVAFDVFFGDAGSHGV